LGQAVEPPTRRGVAASAVDSEIWDLLGKRALSDFAKVSAKYFGQFGKHIAKIYKSCRW
jgi:hypothetical protein